MVYIVGLIEPYPFEVYTTITEHYFEQKLTKLVRVVFLMSGKVNVNNLCVIQALLNEGAVTAVR